MNCPLTAVMRQRIRAGEQGASLAKGTDLKSIPRGSGGFSVVSGNNIEVRTSKSKITADVDDCKKVSFKAD
jgi:hypothetical protein